MARRADFVFYDPADDAAQGPTRLLCNAHLKARLRQFPRRDRLAAEARVYTFGGTARCEECEREEREV